MLKAVLLFILGLILLIKGGDWFVDGATGIAKKFHIPDLLIGATVVSIGTTLPEVMVSASAAAGGMGDMAYGNAIGSVICNTSLIAALTMAVKPGKIDRSSLKRPIIFFFSAALVYSVCAYAFGFFYRWTGIVLLIIFVAYMIVLILQAKKEMKNPQPEAVNTDENSEKKTEEKKEKEHPFWLNIVLLLVGAALITVGANLLVDNGTFIATELGVPQTVIALTFVALGTSLPELVTAITSLAKGHGALSLGNVIGANLFNLVLVSGLSVTISPFKVPTDKLLAGMNASLVLDIPLMILVMLILAIPPLIKGKLQRWQGILLLLIYAGYCAFQFVG